MTSYTLQLSEPELLRYRLMAEDGRASERELWQAAGVRPGAHVADIGCGPGAVTALLAREVLPGGSVVGVDAVASTVEVARGQLASQGLVEPEARVVVGSAADTGLPPASFDVVMMRHVLAHNGGNEGAIVRHLAELVRPGGAVYLVDIDVTAIRIMPMPDELHDLMQRYVELLRRRGNDPLVGLRLADLVDDAGLVVEQYRGYCNVQPIPQGMRPPAWAARDALVAEGLATAEEVERWGVELDALDSAPRRPRMFPSVFVLVARRPA